jgi:hypothetical protein
MRLAVAELDHLRSQGLFIRDKCDACGKVLNQAFRFTMPDRAQVFCSGQCRDSRFFSNWGDAHKHSTPGRCAYCGASLRNKNRGAIFCDDRCRKAFSRRGPVKSAPRPQKCRTPALSNQVLTNANMAG